MEHKFWESCWVSIYTGSTQNVVTPQVCISMKFENLLSCDWYLWGIWLYIFQLGWWVNLWQRPPPSFRFSRRTSRLSLGLRVSHRERERLRLYNGERKGREILERKNYQRNTVTLREWMSVWFEIWRKSQINKVRKVVLYIKITRLTEEGCFWIERKIECKTGSLDERQFERREAKSLKYLPSIKDIPIM